MRLIWGDFTDVERVRKREVTGWLGVSLERVLYLCEAFVEPLVGLAEVQRRYSALFEILLKFLNAAFNGLAFFE